MRRALAITTLLLVTLAAGCDKEGSAPTTAAAPPPGASVPPPAPPPPSSPNEAAARAAALAKGPGTCEEDLVALRWLPIKKTLGYDPHYDRMLLHPQAYRTCLVAMVRDRTPITDPSMGPKSGTYDLGNLAYDMLSELGHIEYGECLPAEVLRPHGSKYDVHEWLADKNHRRQVHRCLGKKLGL